MIKTRGRRSIPEVLIPFGRHLVYAEGTKTEPLYVDDLKAYASEKLDVSENDIEIVTVANTKSKHTVDLVKYAIEDIEKRKEKEEEITNVWIFYDKDDFSDFDEAYRLIRKQDKKDPDIEWTACWSNECFEVWAYHYFENLSATISRDEYIKKINGFLKKNGCKKKYSKKEPRLHHFLTENGGDIKKAMNWMKDKDTDTNKKPNPSSGIYQFAEFLLAYIDEKAKKPT